MECNPTSVSTWKHYKVSGFTIYKAETLCQVRQGLQFLPILPEGHFLRFKGFLGGQFFHTLNCKFNLDIIALDARGRILTIFTAEPNLRQVGPMPANTFYVLETNAGWCARNKVSVGQSLIHLLVEI